MAPHVDRRAVRRREPLRRQHSGASVGLDPAAGEQDDALAVERGEVQVVQDGHDRGAARPPQIVGDVLDARVVPEVEVCRSARRGGAPRLLRERPRQHNPLALAARELVERAVPRRRRRYGATGGVVDAVKKRACPS